MKKTPPVYPYLLAVFPVLAIFSANAHQLVFFEMVLPAAVILTMTFFLVLIARKIVGDADKAAIIVSLFLILFFSYGHVHGFTEGMLLGRHRYLMPVWVLIFGTSAFFTVRLKQGTHNASKVVALFSVVLVASSLINIGFYKLKTRGLQSNYRKTFTAEINDEKRETRNEPRDIYYIILDGYTSYENLKKFYGYDNGEFIGYLEKAGFYVPGSSRSNYALTFLSLASSLNMEYVNHPGNAEGADGADRHMAYDLIENNRVLEALRSKGYKFVHFGCSGWEGTARNKNADREVRCGIGSEFFSILLQTTMLKPFDRYLIRSGARKSVLHAFSELALIHKMDEPFFAFAHFIPPHPPYLFAADGGIVEHTKLEMDGFVWSEKQNYINQLTFINGKVKDLVDGIIANSDAAPIIILQGDHGTATTLGHSDSDNWNHPTEEMLEERTGILNAYYLPDKGDSVLYESITPVNSFRAILNYYFRADYGILPDEIYYSGYKRPYKFTNVTDKIGVK